MPTNSKAAKLAKRLYEQHAKLGNWRDVAREYKSQIIKSGTLNRIANTGGAWMPKNNKILIALGLKKQPRPEWLKIAVRFLDKKQKKLP